MTKGNKRLDGENFADYRLRLENEKHNIKRYLQGSRIWNPAVRGTYIRKEHGNIGIYK